MGIVTAAPLTRDDLRWLSKATTMAAQRSHCGDTIRVEIARRFETRRPGADELAVVTVAATRTVQVLGSVRDLQRSGNDTPEAKMVYRCHAWLPHLQSNALWQTALRHTRVGDRLELRWVAANDNGYLNRADLHLDQLLLAVIPPKAREQVFSLAVSTCPDNTARMIRREPATAADVPVPSLVDVDGYRDAAGQLLAGSRTRRGWLCVAPSVADDLPEVLRVDGVELTVQADNERLADEVVICDRAWSRTLGLALVAPASVRDAGDDAVDLYGQLRGEGRPAREAAMCATVATS